MADSHQKLREYLLVQGEPGKVKADELALVTHCFRLIAFQLAEMMRAWEGKAYNAAAIFGAATLESFLLMKSVLHQSDIRALPRFEQLGGEKVSYMRFLDGMDLGKLLEIARLLHWFPDHCFPGSLVKAFTAHLRASATDSLVASFEGVTNIGDACASYLKEFRNQLHPAASFRNKVIPEANLGQGAAYVFLIAVSALQRPS